MTLSELLYLLVDSTPIAVDSMELEVVFDTVNRSGLTLLSCYVYEGKVHIDIGEEGDDDR